MSDWVPFHRSLISGAKKAWPRATRFILMELSLHARAHRGVIRLAPEWDTLTAVHDLIGGDRREVRKALTLLQLPDENGVPTVEVHRSLFAHSIAIPKWSDHVMERRRIDRDRVDLNPKTDVSRAGPELPLSSGRAELKLLPSNTVELPETKALYSTVQDSTGQIETTAPQDATPVAKGGSQRRGTRIPDGWTPNPESYAKVVAEFGLDAKFVDRTLDEFRDFWRAIPGQRGTKLDWEATFRNRLRESAGRQAASGTRFRVAPKVQPPARPGEFDWQKAAGVDGKDF